MALEHLTPPILQVVGFSGAGKTTLIEQCLPLLIQKGYAPAYLKHSGHAHAFGVKGKDSDRQFQAGALYAAVFSDSHWALQMQGEVDEFLLQSQARIDLILLEGCKAAPFPKIVCVHPEAGVPPLFHWKHLAENPALVWGYLTESVEQAQAINEETHLNIAFQRDDLPTLLEQVLRKLYWYCLRAVALHGAVFIGGQSVRMGEDKAGLDYGHGPHAHYLAQLLLNQELIQKVVYSGVEDSRLPSGQAVPMITDEFRNRGPLGGLLTLLTKEPQAAWLVLACDLAQADEELITYLIQHRNPLKLATGFIHPDGQAEPLAAIYEPRMRFCLMRQLLTQQYSLQSLFQSQAVELLPIPPILEKQLQNINTPEERLVLLKND